MAGIGFLLRKLAAQDNLSGILRAYLHAGVVAVGPWILVVISVSAIIFFTGGFVGLREVNEFIAILLYNFFFSFVLSAGLYMVSARYVSDCLYIRNITPVPGILLCSLCFLLIPAILLATILFVFFAKMTPYAVIMSIINFSLLSQIWLIMLYLGAIRDFRAITLSWTVGTFVVIFLSIQLGKIYGSSGMLTGFNIGLILLLFSLIAQIFAEYPFRFRMAKEFAFYFRYYKGLFWSGTFLFAGMWIDKVIMWGAPEAVQHLNHLQTYPVYDGGMFLSYLSIIPVMGLFIFSLETNFYDSYIKYIHHIERNAPLALIEEEKENICRQIKENGRAFLVLQGVISLIIIVFTSLIFAIPIIGGNFLEFGIFRLGALGAFFGSLNLFIVIFFSYFDAQDEMVIVSAAMLGSNILLTLISRHLGFSFYGYGYCLSMILTFLLGAILFARFLNKLTYHVFVTNVVKHKKIGGRYNELPVSE